MKFPILYCSIILTLALGPLNAVYADSATWSTNPTSSDWNTAENWAPPTVPNGPRDTATFSQSSQTSVSIRRNVQVSQTIFNPGASDYTITVYPPRTLSIGGPGVTNLSGTMQNFVVVAAEFEPGTISFTGTASAGDAIFTCEPPPAAASLIKAGL